MKIILIYINYSAGLLHIFLYFRFCFTAGKMTTEEVLEKLYTSSLFMIYTSKQLCDLVTGSAIIYFVCSGIFSLQSARVIGLKDTGSQKLGHFSFSDVFFSFGNHRKEEHEINNIQVGERTGFLQVMENLESDMKRWNLRISFPGLESHGIKLLALESHGKLKFALIDYLQQMTRPRQCKIERSN